MPIYEYECTSCGKQFERLVLGSDEEITCPNCGAGSPKKLMSGFAHRSGSGPLVSSSGGCSSCSGGSCATCH